MGDNAYYDGYGSRGPKKGAGEGAAAARRTAHALLAGGGAVMVVTYFVPYVNARGRVWFLPVLGWPLRPSMWRPWC